MDYQGFKKQAFISAPGKVILCGQHAVVYGQDALAMAIKLRCKVTISIKQCSPADKPLLIFRGSVIGQLDQNQFDDGPFMQFQDFLSSRSSQQSYNEQCLKIAYKIGVFMKQTQLKFNKNKIYKIQFESQIPIGKCLGSSAAFNTVLTSSLFIILQTQAKRYQQNINLLQVNRISKIFQKVEHGNPSGIDNYVATFGGLVLYNNSKNPPFLSITNKNIIDKLTKQLRIKLIDSGIQKNTKKAVDIVRQHYNKDEKYKEMIRQIGLFSKQIIQFLGNSEQKMQKNCWKQQLFSIMSKNHANLRQLGVSIPLIEEIVLKNTVANERSAKITGSGMGGYVLIAQCSNIKTQENSMIDIITTIDEKGLTIQYF